MDPTIVARAQRGDEEAFGLIVDTSGGRLHAVAHRILRDIDLAEDATQQALLSIWRNLPQLRSGALRRLVVPAPRARLLRRGPPEPPSDAEPSPPAD